MQLIERIVTTQGSSLRTAMMCIDRDAEDIALVVDEQRRLIATLTDGDLRRAVLSGMNLDLPVASLIEKLRSQNKSAPISLPLCTSREAIIRETKARSIRRLSPIFPL